MRPTPKQEQPTPKPRLRTDYIDSVKTKTVLAYKKDQPVRDTGLTPASGLESRQDHPERDPDTTEGTQRLRRNQQATQPDNAADRAARGDNRKRVSPIEDESSLQIDPTKSSDEGTTEQTPTTTGRTTNQQAASAVPTTNGTLEGSDEQTPYGNATRNERTRKKPNATNQETNNDTV